MFAAAPVCLYQDVLSGPATGGEGGNGIYLSIFGKNFGATQGTSTVTVNGKPVAQYLVWGSSNDVTAEHDQISVQIASTTTGTGNIVVTTPGGTCSNLKFTARTGKIWYIGSGIATDSPGNNCTTIENGTAGNGQGGNGTFTNPWKLTNAANIDTGSQDQGAYTPSTQRTPHTYYGCISAGDTLVFLNGVSFLYGDGANLHSSLSLNRNVGSSSSFFTFMARPGAQVQLGSKGGTEFGIRDYSDTHVVVSGLKLTGSGVSGEAFGYMSTSVAPFTRMVGNTATCPDCSASAAVLAIDVEEDVAAGTEVLGNWVYDAGCLDTGGVSNKQYHFIYLAGNNIEIGWNKVGGTGATAGCAYNGIQINYYADSSIGFGNLSIHDNDISNANGAGINMASVDPAQGYINIYNNVIHHVGLKPANDSDSFHTCIAFPGEATTAGAGIANVYNNTLYDCSSYLNTASSTSSCAVYLDYLTAQKDLTVKLVNNIMSQPSYTYSSTHNVYLCGGNVSTMLGGSDNIWYSATTPGSTVEATNVGMIANPLFVSTSTPNLNLTGSSPAIESGSGSLYAALDVNGLTRPNPPTIGAYEYGVGLSSTQITVGATPDAVTVDQPVTLTANVAQTGNSVPSGSISFMNGGVSLGQASLNSEGAATLVVSWPSAGSHEVAASYSGDSNYPAGESDGVALEAISSTTISLVTSPTSVTAGQVLNLTATVAWNGSAAPTGSVNFLIGSTLLGTATLNSSGVATLSTTAPAAGTYSLSAAFLGNASFLSSSSAAVSVTVSAPSKTGLNSPSGSSGHL